MGGNGGGAFRSDVASFNSSLAILPKGSRKTVRIFPITDLPLYLSKAIRAECGCSNTTLAMPKCLFVTGW